jgi:membrane-bound lytic murein transglycosylase D
VIPRAAALGIATSLVAGCTLIGGAPAVVVPPDPLSVPEIEVEPVAYDVHPEVGYLSPPPDDAYVDPILASSVTRDPEFEAAVAWWVDYWQHAARPWFPDFLHRMGTFQQTVDSALSERGLPPSLRYLPLIESGYNPWARSRASAVGMWQFMPATAREFGMEVGAFVDERRNPYKSTEAAVGFLEDLNEDFDSWFLALAAYNGGPNRARRILRQHAPLAQPSDSLFWALRHHWPRETREFVPKLVGAIIVAQSPAQFGYDAVTQDDPLVFDTVTVPEATTLDVLAGAAEVDEEEMRRLNPEIFRGFTPPGSSYTLRVPAGRAGRFAANYAAIPPGERMTVVEHSVAPGETLSHIARRYGISIADLRAANPDVRPRYLQIGTRLTVPIVLARAGAG